jgi:hypothetical protein
MGHVSSKVGLTLVSDGYDIVVCVPHSARLEISMDKDIQNNDEDCAYLLLTGSCLCASCHVSDGR